MAKVKVVSDSKSNQKMRPAITPEAEEKQLVSLAMNQAKKQLIDGTASSQIIVHFLKLGTVNQQLELEKLRHENKLLEAKTEAIQSAKKTEELYRDALKAMRNYSGQGSDDD